MPGHRRALAAKIGDIWDQFDITTRGQRRHRRGQDPLPGRSLQRTARHIIGTKGRCEFNGYAAQITGEKPWKYAGPKVASHQIEHDELFADLRAGKIPNDGDRMAQSTLMGIMGRMSAYTGKEVTWEQALTSKLDTMPKDLKWDMKLPVGPVPEPGVTPLI